MKALRELFIKAALTELKLQIGIMSLLFATSFMLSLPFEVKDNNIKKDPIL